MLSRFQATVQNANTARPSLGRRIAQTFTAPRRLGESVRESAPWIDVLLITLAIALVSIATMPDEVFTASMDDAVTRRGEPVEITSPPEQVAAWGRGMAMLGVIATHPIIAVTVAGLLALVFTLAGKSKAGFREFLSLTCHAMLIPALGTIIAVAVRLITGVGSDSPGVGAYFSPGEASNLFLAALVAIDPFIIWMLVVVAIAAHVIDSRLPAGRVAAVALGAYLVWVVGTTAMLHPELRGEETSTTATAAATGSRTSVL